jgi:DNA-binding IclR family transcriptional regulator
MIRSEETTKPMKRGAKAKLAVTALSRENLERAGDRLRFTTTEEGALPIPSPGIVPALENGIRIIEFLNRHLPHTTSLAEISSYLHISKSHCHAILKTLQYYGWVRFDSRAKTYRLYSGILASASAVWRNPVLDIISERLTRFVTTVLLPCTVAQPQSDGSFVLIHKISSAKVEVSVPLGQRYPADAPAHMRANYAWRPPEALEDYIRQWKPTLYTNASVVTPSQLRKEIAATKKRGYARSMGEYTDGMMSIALPIFDREGDIAYVITCIAPVGMLAPVEATVAEEMRDAVREIHQATLAVTPPFRSRAVSGGE